MSKKHSAPSGAIVIPFPRFRRSTARKAATSVATTPDFDAGFEFAMQLVTSLRASGLLATSLKFSSPKGA